MSYTRNTITAGWQWRLASSNGNANAEATAEIQQWTPVKSFPSVVQMELLAHNLIPDPNVGENERLIQWVGEADWEYACEFSTPADDANHEHVELSFEGLDTFATVWMNGTEIVKSDNMFIPRRVDVRGLLRHTGQKNELVILFESPIKKGKELEAKFGPRKFVAMRDKKRMHERKAQYHWGWDWGPIMLTSGPYRPVHLEAYNSRIEDVYITTSVRADGSSAVVAVRVEITDPDSDHKLEVVMHDRKGQQVAKQGAAVDNKQKNFEFFIQSPELWWPNGQGEQPLYSVNVMLQSEKQGLVDQKCKRLGIRTIKLIQRPLESAPGTTFMFSVNSREIFIQGGDWIPADNLLPTITRKRYFDWVQIAKTCHINMIR
ncbi:hypothetical protein LTR93_012242, partial [Exophiala xenobiotica]